MRNQNLFVSGAVLACAVAIVGCGGKESNGSNRSAGGSNAGGVGTTGGTAANPSTSAGGSNAGGVETNGGSSSNSPSTAAAGSSTGGTGANGGGPPNPSTAAGGSHVGGASTAGGTVSSTGGTSAIVQSTVVGPPAIDILLMVDNSASMADKQAILATAVPQLLARLAQPSCLDSSGAVVGQSQFGTCAQGTPEFKPVNNIHIGVVTSSLGDHGGGQLCTPGKPTSFVDTSGVTIAVPDDVNDKAYLIGAVSRGTTALVADSTIAQSINVNIDSQGFLAWGGSTGQTAQAPTTADLTSAQHALTDMVQAVGERGCGLEAQLESWFRFLIDPVPPILPIQKDTNMQAHRVGSDDALLAQRSAFLRPNSVLAIIMLTDENDCSLRDTDVGWVATDTRNSIKTGSALCATNPNDKCCYSCTANGPPADCADGCGSTLSAAQDDGAYQANIRCYHQKRRFGYEFLYPTSRYVVGLTKQQLCPDQTFGDMDCDCAYAKSVGASCSAGSRRMPNPLYSDVVGQDNSGNNVLAKTNVAPRTDNSVIFLAGIVGVPWQDIGTTDANGNLTYIPVTDPAWTGAPTSGGPAPVTAAPSGIWQNIYGDDNANIVPGDVHMIESLEPRPGIAANDGIEHEWTTAYEDLEYACIFPLPKSKPCACNSTASDYSSCKYLHPNDCCDLTFNVDGRGGPSGSFDKPLCNGNAQVNAKGYPGLREIAVLHDYATSQVAPVSGNSIVTSICAKDASSTSDVNSSGYGYNPAMQAIINRLKEKLPRN